MANKENNKLKEEIKELKQKIKELKQERDKFKHIFEEFQDLYYYTDQNGKIIEISPSVKPLTGYSRDEMIGKNISFVYDNPEDRKKLIKELKQKGVVQNYELRLVKKNGDKTFVSVNSHIVTDKDGNYKGIEGTVRNIDKRKKSYNELLKMNQIMINREMKMIELKKEIERLKNKLNNK